VYVVWLSCELPYAVGVSKNTAHSITGCQRKQSKRADQLRRFFERLVPKNSVLTKLVLFFSLPNTPHTGQSSQLFLNGNLRNAQFLPKLAGAVEGTQRHKSFKNVLRQPTVDNRRNFSLTPTAEMLSRLSVFSLKVAALQVRSVYAALVCCTNPFCKA